MVSVKGEAFEYVNKTMSDDFFSDGRPIHAVRLWGSYWDSSFQPIGLPGTLNPMDGWLITFHWADQATDPNCPPGSDDATSITALGTYFAPVDAVQIVALDSVDCFGHSLYEYTAYLSECCLLCQELDPRSNPDEFPGQAGAFFERLFWRYWMSVQGVTGVMWIPPECPRIFTGKLPSLLAGGDGHYWGWHTSPADIMNSGPLNQACTGSITDFAVTPPECWGYGDWEKQEWECDTMPPWPETQMAFELLTEKLPCEGDANLDGTVDPLDAGFVMARFGVCP